MKIEYNKKSLLLLTSIIILIITFTFCFFTFHQTDTLSNANYYNDMTIRLELFTSNTSKTVDFYQDVLGFKSLISNSSTYHPIQKGKVILGIGLLESLGDNHYFNSKNSNIKFGYGVEIVLEVEDIQSTYNKVKSTNVEIESELKKQPWGLTDFRLIDPNGYYIRVTSRN